MARGEIYPRINQIRDISVKVASAVMRQAVNEGQEGRGGKIREIIKLDGQEGIERRPQFDVLPGTVPLSLRLEVERAPRTDRARAAAGSSGTRCRRSARFVFSIVFVRITSGFGLASIVFERLTRT